MQNYPACKELLASPMVKKQMFYVNVIKYFFLTHVKHLSATPMYQVLFVCVEVLRPSQSNGIMSSAVSLPNHTFTGQA